MPLEKDRMKEPLVLLQIQKLLSHSSGIIPLKELSSMQR